MLIKLIAQAVNSPSVVFWFKTLFKLNAEIKLGQLFNFIHSLISLIKTYFTTANLISEFIILTLKV